MPPTQSLRIGLISDTHGLLRPRALAAMQGCTAIVHAGDIGKAEVLDALRAIAPLHAIRGNIDTAPWAQALPETLDLKIGGVRLQVHHDVKMLAHVPDNVAVVVSGHSHLPALQHRNGVLYINPGSAGPRRFHLPIGVGYLHLEDGGVRGELLDLG
ncbi:metallophosphoesterase family protein [Xanthomonas sacchari]|uniref:metallophosphoesterase family protein n=1 Tax=Xanthomonas sacchari TaxID=56458 RepID=UPI000581D05D|nr:metallophosphoesterase family protein [Xanthomonas sacchari]AJC46766.1 phosphodiesterase [Xanthomonas sacchari]